MTDRDLIGGLVDLAYEQGRADVRRLLGVHSERELIRLATSLLLERGELILLDSRRYRARLRLARMRARSAAA